MKFTTLIPMRFNDGRGVPAEQMDGLIDGLASEFHGCSDEGITKGQWLDPKESRVYRDQSRPISVVCANAQLRQAEQAVVRIGKELGHLAMYFEVRDYDGVQFLKVPQARKSKKRGESHE